MDTTVKAYIRSKADNTSKKLCRGSYPRRTHSKDVECSQVKRALQEPLLIRSQ
ncbi:hypothetical protein A2U01_0021584, partial [Trifolium medium]|nr:hypothetical protein [Trifolium medium]